MERPKKEERAQTVKRVAGPVAVSAAAASAERRHMSGDKKCWLARPEQPPRRSVTAQEEP
jgi:hypothetical protein